MTNKSYTSMTALELIAIAATTPEAVTEMRRRMANTRNLAHANSAKVRSYNSMAKFFGEEPMVFTRKDGTELALAKFKPAMKSAKTVAKKVTKKVAKTSNTLTKRVEKLEADIASIANTQAQILSLLNKLSK